MNYSDLKSALSPLTDSYHWPDPPEPGSYFTIIPTPQTETSNLPLVNIQDIENALADWLDGSSITKQIEGLKKQFQELDTTITQILAEISISELGISVGVKTGNDYPVNAFNFAFEIDFATKPVVGSLTLDSVGLELNLIFMDNRLIWNPILTASCAFLANPPSSQGIQCVLSIGLFSPSIQLMLSETESVSVDDILGAASGTSLSTLQTQMGLTDTSKTTELEMFLVTAELGKNPVFACVLTLDTPDWSWGVHNQTACTLSKIGIAFEHGGGDTSLSIAGTLSIGKLDIDVGISYDSAQEATTVSGGIASQGISLGEFLDDMAQVVGFKNPFSNLTEMELSGVAFSITDVKKGEVTFNINCNGALAFDDTGTSLNFSFSLDKKNGKELDVSLKLGKLTLALDDTGDTLIFTYQGSQKVTFSDLIHLARLYPLYGIGENGESLEFTLKSGLLAILPGAKTKHYLFALDFSFDETPLKKNEILSMLTGGGDIKLDGGVLFAANQAFSLEELGKITGSPISLTAPVQAGISFTGNMTMDKRQISAPLSPPPTNNSTNTNSQPPTPQAVSSSDAASWFNVQKQLGPLYINRIGLKLNTSSPNQAGVDILADASFIIGPMTITAEGFSLGIPLEDPSNFSVDLRGLNVSYNKTPVLINGGFLSQGKGLFIGDLEVETDTLFLSAIGEYANNGAYTTLALFAALTDPPLGGPVFCYITGLAAGGGYNSALNIPTKAADVANFALLQAAASAGPIKNPFAVIQDSMKPKEGEDWIALGLLFRSFELLQSTVLLSAAFGDNFQFAILGQSEMSLPPASDDRVAYARVDVEARYIPERGALAAEGILTSNSYVLSKDCHIQGGFIYILKESGDFILSFGGYPGDFDYAAKGYPAVPRLQLTWNADSHTSIKGQEYFALTPAAMMAGGALQATWSSGIFSAWFDVAVEIMIQWRPFYYKMGFAMSLGVNFDLKVWFVRVHFTFHIGASVEITGPPFHGHAHIDLSVISFDVTFGDTPKKPETLGWSEFRRLLPGDSSQDATGSALLAAKVTAGLKKDLSQSTQKEEKAEANAQPDWVVNGTEFSFTIQSSLPVTETSSTEYSVSEKPAPIKIGVLPMAMPKARGTFNITLKDPEGNLIKASTEPTSPVMVTAIQTDMAPAHWGTAPPTDSGAPPLKCTSGYVLCGGNPTPQKTSTVELKYLLASKVQVISISDRKASANPF